MFRQVLDRDDLSRATRCQFVEQWRWRKMFDEDFAIFCADRIASTAHAALRSFTPALIAAFFNASSGVDSGNPARIASSR